MRRFLKIALAAVLLVILTAGLGGVATGAPAGSVQGSVWADDGEPVVGAIVQASSWDTGLMAGEARTASDGSYSIGGLAFARYRVSAEARGYFPQSYKDGVPGEVWAVPPGATDNIDFVLAPGSTISGYVCQADGSTPLPGARVRVYREAGAAWDSVASGYADAKGFYSLTDEYGPSTGENPVLATTFSVTLTELQPDSHYHYRIILRDSSRNKWLSGDLTFDTPAYYGGRSSLTWKVLGFAVVGLVAVALGFVWVRSR